MIDKINAPQMPTDSRSNIEKRLERIEILLSILLQYHRKERYEKEEAEWQDDLADDLSIDSLEDNTNEMMKHIENISGADKPLDKNKD